MAPAQSAWPPATPSSPLWWMKLSRTTRARAHTHAQAVVQASLDAEISHPLLATIAPVRELPNFSTVRLRISTPAPPEIPHGRPRPRACVRSGHPRGRSCSCRSPRRTRRRTAPRASRPATGSYRPGTPGLGTRTCPWGRAPARAGTACSAPGRVLVPRLVCPVMTQYEPTLVAVTVFAPLMIVYSAAATDQLLPRLQCKGLRDPVDAGSKTERRSDRLRCRLCLQVDAG